MGIGLRGLRATLLGALLLLLAVVPAAASAKDVKPPATLDRSFGHGGMAAFSYKFAPSATLGASTADGTLLVGGGESIDLLSDSGGPGHAFGRVGSLMVPPATGREFEPGAFTVDPQGRLIVVGSSLYPEAENPSPPGESGFAAFKPAVLRMVRFLPGGALDPTFGRGGVVETDLGLPSPRDVEGHRLGTHPSVRATGVTVDPQGRIVVTGGAVEAVEPTCESKIFVTTAYTAGLIARFGPNGSLDPSFGSDGLVGGRGSEELPLGDGRIVDPLVGPTGAITYRSVQIHRCHGAKNGVGRLGPKGHPSEAFGRNGVLLGRYAAVAERPNGAVVTLVAGGRVDEFGPAGERNLWTATGGGTVLDSLAIDRRGRILVSGFSESHRRRSMVLMRLPDERLTVPLPGQRELGGEEGTLFFDPRGRLLTVQTWANYFKATAGITVARFLLRG